MVATTLPPVGQLLGAYCRKLHPRRWHLQFAHPEVVLDARKIAELSYTEAAELAQFGAEILHHKTLEPPAPTTYTPSALPIPSKPPSQAILAPHLSHPTPRQFACTRGTAPPSTHTL